MADEKNNDWGKSVAGIVIKNDKVLLARHTYGPGNGLLIIPGGYVKYNETPQQAIIREVMEETNINAIPKDIVGIRFNAKDWYVIFLMEYISGEPKSDCDENSEVVFMNINEVINRKDVPELTKKLLESVINNGNCGLRKVDYNTKSEHAPYSLYTCNK